MGRPWELLGGLLGDFQELLRSAPGAPREPPRIPIGSLSGGLKSYRRALRAAYGSFSGACRELFRSLSGRGVSGALKGLAGLIRELPRSLFKGQC
eukprot:6716672-Pyramimonas_sp.AAC.1